MKINNKDVKAFGAKQLTVDIQPPELGNEYDLIESALLPLEFKHNVKLSKVVTTIYFRGKDRSDIHRNISRLLMEMKSTCVICFDSYRGFFKGLVASSEIQKTKSKQRYILKVTLNGFFCDEIKTARFNRVAKGEINILGTRTTPCTVRIHANSALTGYSIKGFGEDIVIEKASPGEDIIIDGITGLVTCAGTNIMDRVDIWELPALDPGTNKITFTNNTADVSITYIPMWI